MRLETSDTGYKLHLTANETYEWAHRPYAGWPCSCFRGRGLSVFVDRNGLTHIGRQGTSFFSPSIDHDELIAILRDHLPENVLDKFWPGRENP